MDSDDVEARDIARVHLNSVRGPAPKYTILKDLSLDESKLAHAQLPRSGPSRQAHCDAGDISTEPENPLLTRVIHRGGRFVASADHRRG